MGKYINEEGFPVYSGLWWKFALPVPILAIHGGLAAATIHFASLRPGSTGVRLAGGVLLGLGIWTLFEYFLHRWLLHHRRFPILKKIFWNGLHREHHMYRSMLDPDHHGIHVLLTLPVAALAIGPTALLSRSDWALAASAGWVLGYCGYEAMHWLFHSVSPRKGLLRVPLLRHLYEVHTVHHLRRPDRNYGFITAFWDRRFRTYLPWEEARPRLRKAPRSS